MSFPLVRLLLTMAVCTGGATFPQRLLADPPPVPELSSFQPVVLRVNETNPLTLKGKNLVAIKSIWTSRHGVVPVEQLEAKPNEEGTSTTLQLAVNPMIACGPFALRIITDAGVSQPHIGFLEALREMKVSDDRMIAGTGYLNGTLRDPAGVTFRVSLEQGEELMIDVCAGRLGSKLDPVLTIHRSDGTEEIYVQDSPGVGVDCWHLFKAPRSDVFTIRLRDVRYGSGGNFRYHVRLGQVRSTTITTVRGLKNFPLSASTTFSIPDPEGDRFFDDFQQKNLNSKPMGIAVLPGSFSDELIEPDPGYDLTPVSRYRVGTIGSYPEEIDWTETIYGDLSLNGYFEKPDELLKLYLVVDKPGLYRWTAISRQLGAWGDPALRLKSKDGQLLKESHMFNNESALSYNFKNPGTYKLELWDIAGQFGWHARFHIHAQKDPAEFELNTESDSLRIEPGKDVKLKISIDRDGYNGPVKFAITTPVDGVSISDAIARKGAKEATVKLALNETANPGTTFPIKISGYRGEKEDAPRAPLYTQGYWRNQFRDLYSPMFEFEDTIWITVLPSSESEDKTGNSDETR